MSRKEKFLALIKKHNYTSVLNFCVENKLVQPNVQKRLNNEDLKVDISTLFVWANILSEPIDTLIEIFYPAEFKDNKKLSGRKKI